LAHHRALIGTLEGIVVSIGACRAVQRVFGAIQVIWVQPLPTLALGHTCSVTIRHSYLGVSSTGADIHAEMGVWVSPRRSGTTQETGIGDVVSEGIGADLDAFVMAAESLGVVACRASLHTFVHIVVFESSWTVSGTGGVGIPIFKHEERKRTGGAARDTPHIIGVGDEA